MSKKKISILGISMLRYFFSFLITNGITLHLPGGIRGNGDFNVESEVVSGQYSLLETIQFTNKYLRFAIGFVCFLFTIINGYKLITAQGDEKTTKDATKALIGCVIGIGICLLSYIIVNITLRLFA